MTIIKGGIFLKYSVCSVIKTFGAHEKNMYNSKTRQNVHTSISQFKEENKKQANKSKEARRWRPRELPKQDRMLEDKVKIW